MNYKKIALAMAFAAIGSFSFAAYQYNKSKNIDVKEKTNTVVTNGLTPGCALKCQLVNNNSLTKPVAKGCVFKTVFNEESSAGFAHYKTPENVQSSINKGLKFIAAAQHPNGGWGAGLHSMQHINDPHAVKPDPATTSMIAMALLRCGNTLDKGEYATILKNATKYLLAEVDANKNEATITKETGTQIQVKLGVNIDAVITSQFLSNLLTKIDKEDELVPKIKTALDICIKKIQDSQEQNGRTSGGSWAGVLQSSMANAALESAKSVGGTVDMKKLEQARNYQESNYNAENGTINTDDGAGIMLYSMSSSVRGSASRARDVREQVEKAKKEGKIKENEKVSVETLKKIGYDADKAIEMTTSYNIYESAKTLAQTEDVMNGFGNNGGEEFISFLQTGESMVVSKDDAWKKWYDNISGKMLAIQNADGSWNGHHCITSPTFCTATCLLILSVNNDIEVLTTMGSAKQ